MKPTPVVLRCVTGMSYLTVGEVYDAYDINEDFYYVDLGYGTFVYIPKSFFKLLKTLQEE